MLEHLIVVKQAMNSRHNFAKPVFTERSTLISKRRKEAGIKEGILLSQGMFELIRAVASCFCRAEK